MKEIKTDLEKAKSFFYLDVDKSDDKLNSLVGEYIIFELYDKDKKMIMVLPGKLLSYKDNVLKIRQYDDGTEDTKSHWTTGDGEDLFLNFEEEFNKDQIKGIEKYFKYNEDLEFKEEFCSSLTEITNKNDDKLVVMIDDFDGYGIWFKYKINQDDVIGVYPFYLLKSINLIK
ncbi:MAG: hypothetical protein RSE91_00535 [Bacilli bacterium]